MKRKFSIVFLLLSFLVQSQKVDNLAYDYIKHSKRVPPEVLKSYTEKASRDIDSRDPQNSRRERKDEEYFLRHNAYYMHKLLNNGFIYFGDPVTEYCDAVLDKLLEDDIDLRNKFTVFTVKSPEVNAFMTHDGYMFINLGLLAQIENEAQLASVMSHEIIHYMEEHAISGHKTLQKLKRQVSIFKPQSVGDLRTNVLNYSKEYEYAADSLGLELYLKAGYKPSEVLRVMDVLLYSYLPYDEVEIDYSFLEIGQLRIPEKMKVYKFGELTAAEDVDDSKSTHPNIAKRKTELKKKIEAYKSTQETVFKLDEREFNEIQRLARFEISRQMLVMADYDKALYHNFLLNRDYKNNEYITLNTAISFNGIVTYQSSKKSSKVLGNTKNVEGNLLSLTSFARDNDAKNVGAVAVAYCYEASKMYPKNSELKKIFNRTLKTYIKNYKLKNSDFDSDVSVYNNYFTKNDSSLIAVENKKDEEENLSKLDKLKLQKKTKTVESDDFYKIAFAPYLNETEFKSVWDIVFQEIEEAAEDEFELNSIFSDFENEQKKNRKNKELIIDKVLAVSPTYNYASSNNQDQLNFNDTEKGQIRFNNLLREVCEKNHVDVEIFHASELSENDVEKFNDMAVLQQYISERFFHGNINAYVSNTDRVKEIAEKYDSRYILYTGTFSLKNNSLKSIYRKLGWMILFYNIPYQIFTFTRISHETLYYSFIFDVENGDLKYYDLKKTDIKNYDASIWSHLDQTIKAGKKKSKKSK